MLVFAASGARLAVLPGVWRLLPLPGVSDRFAAVTLATWGRYAEQPMASGARVILARWSR